MLTVWYGLSYSFCCCFLVIVSNLWYSMDCSPPGSSIYGFSRQAYWRGLPFPSPGDLPDPGIKPMSPGLADGFFIAEPPAKPNSSCYFLSNLAIPLLGICPEKTMVWKDTCTPIFITALFTIAKAWKQPKCPSTDE